MKRLTIFLLLASCAAMAGHIEKVPETVVAQRDGQVLERERFDEGTSHVSRSVTNFIVHTSSKGERILLTIRCRGGRHSGCFALTSGQSYSAVFEYRVKKDSDLVLINGQPGGNLTKFETMKSAVVNFEELKP
jgi:hypothetical protein